MILSLIKHAENNQRKIFGLVLTALLALGSGGCRTATAPGAARSEPYRPITPQIETAAALDHPRQAPAPQTQQRLPPSPPVAENAVADQAEPRLRLLQPGDRLEVYLHGIPEPQQLPVVVDEAGFITMPLIGQVKVSGKTGSEVERQIENIYIKEEYYRNINCVVIPPTIQFFVRGEVKQPGRYPLTRDVTLLQAIALAGGYTEYAQPRRIAILRGSSSFNVNATRVERGEEPSPPIKPGDIIAVPRRWW